MAYGFPDSPTIGQEVNGYIWDGQKWVKRQPGDATISPTPPLDAHPGQLWWESDTGDLYIYYHDGTSAQWVGVDTSGSPGNWTVDGTGLTTFNGNIQWPIPASATPASNSQIIFQLTSDTQLTIKVKGTDGVVRSANITLA